MIAFLNVCPNWAYSVEYQFADVDVSSHLPREDYLVHKIVQGDSPAYIMKRLGLLPITTSNGSLHHFYRLNPDILNYENIPGGTLIYLPITQLPSNENPKMIWKEVNGRVYFKRRSGERNIASDDDNDDFRFGTPHLRMKVKKDSKLVKKMIDMGYADQGDVLDYAIIEVPILKGDDSSEITSRRPASVSSPSTSLRKKSPQKVNWQVEAGTTLGIKQYTLVDSIGQDGNISSTSLPGVYLKGRYKRSWLDLRGKINVEQESVDAGSGPSINQNSNQRTDFNLAHRFTLLKQTFHFGLGLQDTPFVSQTTGNGIDFDYISNTYFMLDYEIPFKLIGSIDHSIRTEFRYYLGGSANGITLQSSYGALFELNNKYAISNSSHILVKGELGYIDFNPDVYSFTELSMNLIFGFQWDF